MDETTLGFRHRTWIRGLVFRSAGISEPGGFQHSEFNCPVRPGTTQDGTGRCHAVRPWAGWKRCRLFQPGRGRTNETTGDGEVPSPAVIYRHPWILLSVLEQLYNTHYNTRYNHSDINPRFFSNLTLVFL